MYDQQSPICDQYVPKQLADMQTFKATTGLWVPGEKCQQRKASEEWSHLIQSD